MANEQNLRPSEYKLSLEEAKKGGIKSGETRRKNRDRKLQMQKWLDMLLNDPETIDKLKESGVSTDGMSYEDAMDAMQIIKAAKKGDTIAYKAAKEEAYGKLDNKAQLEVSGEVSGININIKRYDKEGNGK